MTGQYNRRRKGMKGRTGMGLAKPIKVQVLYVLHQRRPVHSQLAISSKGQVRKRAFQTPGLFLGSPAPNHVGHPITDNSGKC
jgi:hypothetical protein